jgi:phosphoribosylformylglycinamidine synthase subunit PurQ / glutaminase
MARPRVLVLRAPGTNCDQETAFAFEQAGAEAVRLHINQLIERPQLGQNYQMLCLPGGFSYGDDIAAGKILALTLEHHLQDLLATYREQDRLVLGICNGFQVLMRLGILFDTPAGEQPPATLYWNSHGRFEDRWVHLEVRSHQCPFLNGIDRLFLPMAHAEGRVVFQDAAAADALEHDGQLAIRYAPADGPSGDRILDFPTNPNGAERNIAGMCDPSGRILGLMPHPERFLFGTQHPYWTRLDPLPEHGAGVRLFQNAVDYFA